MFENRTRDICFCGFFSAATLLFNIFIALRLEERFIEFSYDPPLSSKQKLSVFAFLQPALIVRVKERIQVDFFSSHGRNIFSYREYLGKIIKLKSELRGSYLFSIFTA